MYDYDPLTFRLVSLDDAARRPATAGPALYLRPGRQPHAGPRPRPAASLLPQPGGRPIRLVHLRRALPADRGHGREHLGQAANRAHPAGPAQPTDAPRVGLPQPGDGAAMAHYVERYLYDEVGNLLRMAHRSADPTQGGWTRRYHYREPSLLQAERYSNRLTGTGPARAARDRSGSPTTSRATPPHAANPGTPLGPERPAARHRPSGCHSGTPSETTYYVYDAAGQRVRKVTEHAADGDQGLRKSERIYLGAFEVYREYGADGTSPWSARR